MRRFVIYILSSIFLIFGGLSHASTYEIVFEEGGFKYSHDKPDDFVDNKYLASITVKKDGKVIASDIRGSTIPDAWAYYTRWHVNLGNKEAMNDKDVMDVHEFLSDQANQLKKANAKIGTTSLSDLADIVKVINQVPVLETGIYTFKLGLHRSGKTAIIKDTPVPRLMGGAKQSPYQVNKVGVNSSAVGGFIKTLNRNMAQDQKYIANGINVHRGRLGKNYKDSEGCLTIHPGDWSKFHKLFPSIKEWKQKKHKGLVQIIRGK